jgi:carbohydrate-binding DOMON domain-containing protein
MKESKIIIYTIMLLIVLPLLNSVTAQSQGMAIIFDVVDPEGDDVGPGNYTYPTADVFEPGVFDLTRFTVLINDTHVMFKIYVRNLGDNPWNAPNGFCLQYIHIYVRTTADLPTNSSTFGLDVAIDTNYAWHFAVLIAPGWEENPVPVGQKSAIYYSNNNVTVQNSDFKTYPVPEENAIVAVVKKELLPDVNNIDSWKYVVAVTSFDGFGPERIRPVGIDPGEWNIGGGDAAAIAVGVAPRIMDLLAPTPEEQYEMLSSYQVDLDSMTGSLAVVRGVSGAPEVSTITVTETYTKTETETKTETLTTTKTISETHTEPVTITEKLTDYTLTGTIGIILLIIGLAVGMIIGRKK